MCLVVFDWMVDIVNVILLSTGVCCTPVNSVGSFSWPVIILFEIRLSSDLLLSFGHSGLKKLLMYS